MNKTLTILLITALFLVAGCTQKSQDFNPEPGLVLYFGGNKYFKLDENETLTSVTIEGNKQIIMTSIGDKVVYNIDDGNFSKFVNGTLVNYMKTAPGNPYKNELDEHGCMYSEGYIWCEEKSECLRLGKQCEEPEIDEHGCEISQTSSWCEAKQKCIKTWEEFCDQATLEKAAASICEANYIEEMLVCDRGLSIDAPQPGREQYYFWANSTDGLERVNCINSTSEICKEIKESNCRPVEGC